MEHMLTGFVFILAIVVAISVFNEKTLKIPNDIALVLFAFLFGVIFKAVTSLNIIDIENEFIAGLTEFKFDEILMEGILCFMLFAGSSKVHFHSFVKNLKPITLLALLTTIIYSIIYGLLFYLVSTVTGIGFDIWTSILLGCILSLTESTSAANILHKAGLSKNVVSIIEGETLFNDGAGVTMLVFVKNIIIQSEKNNFALLMAEKLFGAIAVGLGVSFVLFAVLKRTNDPTKHIIISLLDVSLTYIICEACGFSGVVASAVCGMYFSYFTEKCERWKAVVDQKDYYKDFWDILDTLLNNVLFVLIGVSILNIPYSEYIVILTVAAVVLNLIARSSGVFVSTLIIGRKHIPNRYSVCEFVPLITWSGLKGGLSLAFALSAAEYLPETAYNVVMIVTYITIFFTTVVQGLTVSPVYRMVEKSKQKRLSAQ